MREEPRYPITIFYDGACGICRREMERYQRRDVHGRLRFVDIQSPTFSAEREGLHPHNVSDYIHARDAEGVTVFGVEAFQWIWQACGYRVLASLAGLTLLKPLARLLYRLIATYRYTLSGEKRVCGPECNHPTI